ncbi:LLM class flavin-dependent oxidoreductase [Pseudorhodoplanes sinuspersici]|uniref:LLM class flavin-dependent oxidoreductase n=1 Tax=Pseudorhodoplanes sinuspersici TaxID=1235591 RepID=A0A1W6ZL07_9HYPH|nr:LLM class flavin-dependent oxidoreductase [Pseudorhodoplanes sinuspersici]ARP98012.1 LLM class flavin-dependent oxidoreductase [Pseudorhodoplanes sinuspersici]RKE68234.1 alkanesulfonate monooxygenase SsuD/methylene tetrahydromethanopterin reductase-like flavin-dependent oxidoreductase (luciferase family) [Pseudorhodoplanes sinuspersici]
MRLSIFSVQDHYPSHNRSVAALYEEVISQAVLADGLGYDTFWVAEHHFHEYGAVPNPAIMLAAIAQRTQRLRLGTAISILTFHNPLTIAENYAMVDLLSGGRLMYGVGSGYLPHEFGGYGVDPAEKRDRFDEVLAAVKKLLSGKRCSHAGQYHNFKDVKLNVTPIQASVPIYVAVLRKEAAYHVGKQGNNLLCVPYASVDKFEDIAEIVSEFRRGRVEAGVPADDNSLALALHTHVAETDQKARETAADAFDLYVDTRLYARKSTYDDAMKNGIHLFGSVKTVEDKLVALKQMGVQHVMTLQNFGNLPTERVHESMNRLMSEVTPAVNNQVSASAA